MNQQSSSKNSANRSRLKVIAIAAVALTSVVFLNGCKPKFNADPAKAADSVRKVSQACSDQEFIEIFSACAAFSYENQEQRAIVPKEYDKKTAAQVVDMVKKKYPETYKKMLKDTQSLRPNDLKSLRALSAGSPKK